MQVNDKMQVLDKQNGNVIPNLYCIGDANGKMMLAHAASAQGISAVENICNREHVVSCMNESKILGFVSRCIAERIYILHYLSCVISIAEMNLLEGLIVFVYLATSIVFFVGRIQPQEYTDDSNLQ